MHRQNIKIRKKIFFRLFITINICSIFLKLKTMIKNSKKSVSFMKSFGKAFIAAEVAAFFGCYFFWRKLNKDQVKS